MKRGKKRLNSRVTLIDYLLFILLKNKHSVRIQNFSIYFITIINTTRFEEIYQHHHMIKSTLGIMVNI